MAPSKNGINISVLYLFYTLNHISCNRFYIKQSIFSFVLSFSLIFLLPHLLPHRHKKGS